MQISCPWCGPRNSTEFHHHGPVRSRPNAETATRSEWHQYLYFRDNPCGIVKETWYHSAGCRQFFTILRDTYTNKSAMHQGDVR
ncbi:MAG: sarcosine oxidase subunit delta [Actinomycetota bacterium]